MKPMPSIKPNNSQSSAILWTPLPDCQQERLSGGGPIVKSSGGVTPGGGGGSNGGSADPLSPQ